jgi:hypothetical protein
MKYFVKTKCEAYIYNTIEAESKEEAIQKGDKIAEETRVLRTDLFQVTEASLAEESNTED